MKYFGAWINVGLFTSFSELGHNEKCTLWDPSWLYGTYENVVIITKKVFCATQRHGNKAIKRNKIVFYSTAHDDIFRHCGKSVTVPVTSLYAVTEINTRELHRPECVREYVNLLYLRSLFFVDVSRIITDKYIQTSITGSRGNCFQKSESHEVRMKFALRALPTCKR